MASRHASEARAELHWFYRKVADSIVQRGPPLGSSSEQQAQAEFEATGTTAARSEVCGATG